MTEPAPDNDSRQSLAETLASKSGGREQLPRGAVIGRYLVTGLLGEGGMGTVYSAYDPDLGRAVAIKLHKFAGDDADDARARLLHEAQAMARLAHPNVLAVYDAGPHGEELFVAMELVDGDDLYRWLRDQPRTRREIFEKFHDAGQGLVAAHRAGMVHRDFKPDNVLVGKDGRVRVTDFGLAHVDERPGEPPGPSSLSKSDPSLSRTLSGQISGTPAYMAPEQFLAGATDARTDQFAFCVALWEALCGERPFEGNDYKTLRENVVTGAVRVRAPLPGYPGMSGELRRVLLRGLGVRPEDRHSDLATILTYLRRRIARTREKLLARSAAVLLLAGAVGYFGVRAHQEGVRCAQESKQEMAKMWGAAQRDAVLGALASSRVPEAEVRDAVDRLERSMQAWAHARAKVCDALRTREGGVGLAQAAQCLDENGLRADAVVRVLSRPLPEGVPALRQALDRWEIPDVCLWPLETPPVSRSREARGLRQAVEEAVLLSLLGRHEQAIAEARRLLPEARARGAVAEAAELGRALALSLWQRDGPSDEARDALRQAIRDADASAHDKLSLTLRVDMANFLAEGQGKPAEAEPFALDASAWLRRTGGDEHLEQDLASSQGSIALATGRTDDAIRHFLRQAELASKSARSHKTPPALSNLALAYHQAGRMADAIDAQERQVAALQASPETVPMKLALARTNLALYRMSQGHLDLALASVDRALRDLAPVRAQNAYTELWIELCRAEILELRGEVADAARIYAKVLERPEQLRDVDVAEAKAGLARTFVAQGRAEEALEPALQAVKLGRDASDAFTRGFSHLALAQALWETGAEKAKALEQGQKALAAFEKPSQAFLRGKVEAWLQGKDAK